MSSEQRERVYKAILSELPKQRSNLETWLESNKWQSAYLEQITQRLTDSVVHALGDSGERAVAGSDHR